MKRGCWCNLNGIPASIKLSDVMPNGEKEPFEASYMLDDDPDHWAWEELFEDWKSRQEED